jgi:hypothetical protein
MADEARIERTPVLVVGGDPAGIDLETAAGFPRGRPRPEPEPAGPE